MRNTSIYSFKCIALSSKKRFLKDQQKYWKAFMLLVLSLLLIVIPLSSYKVQSFVIIQQQSTTKNRIIFETNTKFQPITTIKTTSQTQTLLSSFSLSLSSLSSTTMLSTTTAQQNLFFNQIRKSTTTTTTTTTTAIQLQQQLQQKRKQSVSFILHNNNYILSNSNTKLRLQSSDIEDSRILFERKGNNQRQWRIRNSYISAKIHYDQDSIRRQRHQISKVFSTLPSDNKDVIVQVPVSTGSTVTTLNDNNNYEIFDNKDTISTGSDYNEDQESRPSNAGAPKRFINFPFTYHEEIIIRIESISNRGYGIGRVEIPQSSVVLSTTTATTTAATNDFTNDDSTNSTNTDTDTDVLLLNEIDDNEDLSRISSNDDNNNNNNKKWVIMVPNVIENELVHVRIFRNYNNYSEGDLVEIIEPSIYRTESNCIYYNECGGCQFQHVQIQQQRIWKTKFVIDAIQQYNLSNHLNIYNVHVNDCIGTNEIYNYRTKITPHYQAPITLSRQQKRTNHKNKQSSKIDIDTTSSQSTTTTLVQVQSKLIDAIGFQKRTSRTLVDIEYCAIATEEINSKYNVVRTELLSQPSSRTKGATLLFRQDDLPVVASTTGSTSGSTSSDTNTNTTTTTTTIVPYVTTNNNEYITTTVNNIKFTYKAGNFFQNNYYVLPIMVNHVIDQATKPAIVSSSSSSEMSSSIETIPMTHLVDCYCGSGLFALSLAKYFTTVIGIEINDNAVQEAINNSKQNNITNCQFVSSNALNIFTSIQQYPKNTTVVIIDPPRKGCTPEFLYQLYQFNAYRIVYMSCDPITQCRDAADIVNTGLYTITSIQPFDLFPQTRHIECLIIFDKKETIKQG